MVYRFRKSLNREGSSQRSTTAKETEIAKRRSNSIETNYEETCTFTEIFYDRTSVASARYETSISKILKDASTDEPFKIRQVYMNIDDGTSKADAKTTGSSVSDMKLSPEKRTKLDRSPKKVKITFVKSKSSQEDSKTCFLHPSSLTIDTRRKLQRKISDNKTDKHKIDTQDLCYQQTISSYDKG